MTPHPSDPPDGIEPFAVLSARLAAARAALLREHGLDELRWTAIEAAWAERFQREEGEALAARFRALHAAALHNLAELAGPPTEPAAPPAFLSQEAQPWREEAAKVPPAPRAGAHPLAGTAAPDLRSLRPALPFAPPAPRAPHPLAATLESPTGLPLGPALPFAKR